MTNWLGTIWQRPRVHGGDEERRVSFLELFFDLVFVVVIARLAHLLSAHPEPGYVIPFILPFIAVWWVWIGMTYYSERFETYDLSFRVFILLQMLIVASMAVFAETALKEGATGFALSYAAARLLIAGLWWRAGRHNPQVRPVTNIYTLGFLLSAALWIGSIFFTGWVALLLKGLGLLVDLITPWFTLSHQGRVFPTRHSKLPERFGLFVIIVLGESMVGVVNGLADAASLDAVTLVRFALGFLVGFGLWWVYFDFVGRRQPGSFSRWTRIGWSYLHLPMVMGVAAVGATIEHAIALEGAVMEAEARLLLAGSFALAYLFIGLLEYTLAPDEPPLVHPHVSSGIKFVTAAVALAAGLMPLGGTVLLAVLVGLHLVTMTYGVAAWFRSVHWQRNTAHH